MDNPGRRAAGDRLEDGRLLLVQTIIEIVVAVAVVLAVGGGLFYRSRGRRGVVPPSQTPAPPQVVRRPPAPATASALETTVEIDTAGPALPPEITEVPEPAAGRLVRLRSRLARSESTLGKGLLALLSRDALDDDTWDEVEDLLLTADVGVAATTELVDSLRTQAKVLGTRTPDDAKRLRDQAICRREELKLGRDTLRRHPALEVACGVFDFAQHEQDLGDRGLDL